MSQNRALSNQDHNLNYYLKCMLGGALACGLTHIAIVPLDVAKCKIQINSSYAQSMIDGIRKVKINKQLTLGWGPTAIGYSMQGSGKFGFYQGFKDLYKKIVGEENAEKYRKIGWSLASASAELIADLFLCPFEAVKLKIQLSRPGFQYPKNMLPAFAQLHAQQGLLGMFKGLVPLWGRQVPYTVVKFVFFQLFVQKIYLHILTKEKSSYSKPVQLSVTFISGFLAGIICAIVSHPSDTIVSKLYSQGKSSQSVGLGTKINKIYKEIGWKGLWAGLGTRVIMIGTIAGFQWWIYDSFKTIVGLQTTGGIVKKAQ